MKELADVRQHCTGNYYASIKAARFCFALLLHEDPPDVNLREKIKDEWTKLRQNDQNVFGDSQHLHNALYFNALPVTKDKGFQKMCNYCGLKWVN